MSQPTTPKLHQIIGTTIYIGRTELATLYGQVTAYTFQDLIHKGYIICLAHGDLNAPELYTRLHSSCVTSELMRSLDCDCVQQLNGAIKKICSGNGILFYLIQEGRGCGYVGKSRACMTVQYYEQERNINTFQAYESLGMKHDYRDYTSIRDINKILQINSDFILLTNNPDKIEKFTKLGIKLKGVESIEITPNPFNQTYLHSKQQYGHILYQAKTKVQKYLMPYPRIKPFTPYSIPGCERFIKVASYYLPIKPVDNRIVLTPDEYSKFCQPASNSYQIVRNPGLGNQMAYYAQLAGQQIEQNPEHLTKPNWFQINVHYDMVTNQDYLVLKYGSPENNQVPIVRIHSESLFNRFPLVDREYKQRYKRSLDYVIRNGYGIILIFYNDGRGSGLSYLVLNMENQAKGVKSDIGVEEDKRDYYGATKLLRHYIDASKPIDLLCGRTSQQRLQREIQKSGIKVRKYINLASESERKGSLSIEQRIRSLNYNLSDLVGTLDLQNLLKISQKISQAIASSQTIYCTGIGSSQAHSRCLETLFNQKIKHINPMQVEALDKQRLVLVVFSQGLSPNIICCVQGIKPDNLIIVTSVDVHAKNDNPQKQQFIDAMKNGGSLFLTYPKQVPDDTLIRITGPFLGFFLVVFLHSSYQQTQLEALKLALQSLCSRTQQSILNINQSLQASNPFIQHLAQNRNLILCCDYPAVNFIANIRFKFIQGAMVNCHIIDYANLAHGTFQFLQNQHNRGKYCVWFITKQGNQYHSKAVKMLALDPAMCYTLHYGQGEAAMLPMLAEVQANYVVFQLVQQLGVDQHEWAGKGRQKIVYQVYK